MSQHAIGSTGVVIVATRGDRGPGEVSLHVGGATDSYLAWSVRPIPRGTEVVATDSRGPRTVEVEPLAGFDESPDVATRDDDDRDEPPDPTNLLAL